MDTLLTDKLEPLRYESAPLRHKIIASLRRAIELGILEPGSRLIERDLCRQLKVSRTSLREALRQLQAEGILTDTANRALAVAQITHEDAANIYRIRSVLEALVVGQFIEKAADAEIQALAQQSEIVKGAYRSGDPERIVEAKHAFYDSICRGARNPIAFDMLNRLTLLTSPLRRRSVARKERQKQSIAEIDALVRAIAKRDVAKARRAAETHVENSARSAFIAASMAGGEKAEIETKTKPTRKAATTTTLAGAR